MKTWPRHFFSGSLSASESGDHHGFDRVHAVLRLIEGDASLGFENFLGDFDTVLQAELFGHLFADLGIRVVKSRQTVHELHVGIARSFHHGGVYLGKNEGQYT